MKNKFSPDIQNEIKGIIYKIQSWKDLFDFQLEFFFDGWAIYLKERSIYPRSIVIFKSYEKNQYSIKSFEVHLQNFKKEELHELYSVEHIKDQKKLITELKEIIYGKDLGNYIQKMYDDTFSL